VSTCAGFIMNRSLGRTSVSPNMLTTAMARVLSRVSSRVARALNDVDKLTKQSAWVRSRLTVLGVTE
jgi:hypothetical protein